MPQFVINATSQLIFDLTSTSENDEFSFSLLAKSAEILVTAFEKTTKRAGYVLQLDSLNKTTGLTEFRALRCFNMDDVSKNCELVHSENVIKCRCIINKKFLTSLFEGESFERRYQLEPFKI
jgi:hypothetical protein